MNHDAIADIQRQKNNALKGVADLRARKMLRPQSADYLRDWIKRQYELMGGNAPHQFAESQIREITANVARLLEVKMDTINREAAKGKLRHRPNMIQVARDCGVVLRHRHNLTPDEFITRAMNALIDTHAINPSVLDKEYQLIAKFITIQMDRSVSELLQKFNEL